MRINKCGHDHSTLLIGFKRTNMNKITFFAIIGMAGALSLVAVSGAQANAGEGYGNGQGTQRMHQHQNDTQEGPRGEGMYMRGDKKNAGEERQLRHRVERSEGENQPQNRYEMRHMERGDGQHRNVNTEAREAVEANNWEAFKAAVKEKFFGKKIESEEDFNKMQRAHQLREEGNHDEAREIMKELGFERPGKGDGNGRGHRQDG